MSGERLWSLDEGRLGRLPASIAHWTSATLFGLLGAAALLMVMRRLAGALPNPLEPAPLLAVAVIVAVGVFVIRLGWPVRSPAGEMSAAAWLAMLGTSLAVVALGTAVCAGGTHVVALFAFWTLLVLEESWAWQRILRRPKAEATGRSWRFWR